MTVKFTTTAKKNPRDPSAPPKYYAVVKSNGRVDLRQVARRIADISTISSADTLGVLEALLMVIPQLLAEGQIVRLGDLGSFRLTVKSEGMDSPEEVTVHTIDGLSVRFTPGKLFKQALANVEFEKLS